MSRSKKNYRVSNLRLLMSLVLLNIRIRLTYTLDFSMEIIIFALSQSVGLLTITVIFTKVHAINGWTLPQMVFLYGLFILSMSLYRLFLQGVRDVPFLVQNGDFDQILTKPRAPLLLLASRRTNINGLGELILGLALVIIAAWKMSYKWTFVNVSSLALFIVSSNMIIIALFLMQATVSFWLIRFEALHQFISELRAFCRYPLKIYPRLLRILLTIIVPLGFTSYYPACWLLQIESHGIHMLILTLAVALCMGAACIAFFNFGLRYYSSTGS